MPTTLLKWLRFEKPSVRDRVSSGAKEKTMTTPPHVFKNFIRMNYTDSLGKLHQNLELEDTFRKHCASSDLCPTDPLEVLIEQYIAKFPTTNMKIWIVNLSDLGKTK